MTASKRLPGDSNDRLEAQREILRFVHSKKEGVAESEIRDFAKEPPLNISVPKNVKNHLDNLEKKHFINHKFIDYTTGNTWYSDVYYNISYDLKKSNYLELTEQELRLIDFLIKYSNTFLYLLFKHNIVFVIDNAKKMLRIKKIANTLINFRKEHDIKETVAETINSKHCILPVANICLSMDLLNGFVDSDNSVFWKEYENVMADIIGKEKACNYIQTGIKAITLTKPEVEGMKILDDISKEING